MYCSERKKPEVHLTLGIHNFEANPNKETLDQFFENLEKNEVSIAA